MRICIALQKEGMTDYPKRAVDLRRARYDSVMKVLKKKNWLKSTYLIVYRRALE